MTLLCSQYGAVLDVAGWFNDFVSVAGGGGGSGGPAAPPHRRGRRRLSLGGPLQSDADRAGGAGEQVDAPAKQRGRKRKAVAERDAGSSGAGEGAATAVGDYQQGAAECGAESGRSRRTSAAKAVQSSRAAKQAAATAGRVGTVRWANDGDVSANSDAHESEGMLQVPTCC